MEFQVGTGRMPLARQEAQAGRKTPQFTHEEARRIGAYIQSLGGGPQCPGDREPRAGGDVSLGGELFRVNCSSCHAFGGGGGALSSGKYAPAPGAATDREIYAAMLTGPQNMPVFGDNQLTPGEEGESSPTSRRCRPTVTRAAGAWAGSGRCPRVWPSS